MAYTIHMNSKYNKTSCTFCFQPSPPLSSGGLCGPAALMLWECAWCPAGLSGPPEAPPDCGTTSVWGTDCWAWHRQLHPPWGGRRGGEGVNDKIAEKQRAKEEYCNCVAAGSWWGVLAYMLFETMSTFSNFSFTLKWQRKEVKADFYL